MGLCSMLCDSPAEGASVAQQVWGGKGLGDSSWPSTPQCRVARTVACSPSLLQANVQ